MSDHCGTITEDGNAVCAPGACSCSSEAKSNQSIILSVPAITENKNQENSMWKKIRSGFMFVIACIASPCCTPIIVPIGIALLAGTPVAIWASANIGWVYGGLTLLSIVSFVLGFRWINQKAQAKSQRKLNIPSIKEINQL